jgi:Flp pilus assembly protein TadG
MIGKLTKYLRRGACNVRRFGRAQRGATAVEFALIAPAFIATLVAVLQVCVFLFAQMAIQNAAVEAGRYFMTGQAQNGQWTASTIITKVCTNTNLSVLFNCSNMYVVVQNYSTFSSASTSAPAMYNGNTPITSYTFDPGTQGDVMVVQLIYAWPVVGAPFGFNLSNLPNNQTQLMGISAFRVEPYAASSS